MPAIATPEDRSEVWYPSARLRARSRPAPTLAALPAPATPLAVPVPEAQAGTHAHDRSTWVARSGAVGPWASDDSYPGWCVRAPCPWVSQLAWASESPAWSRAPAQVSSASSERTRAYSPPALLGVASTHRSRHVAWRPTLRAARVRMTGLLRAASMLPSAPGAGPAMPKAVSEPPRPPPGRSAAPRVRVSGVRAWPDVLCPAFQGL